jgi:hypothetical protein
LIGRLRELPEARLRHKIAAFLDVFGLTEEARVDRLRQLTDAAQKYGVFEDTGASAVCELRRWRDNVFDDICFSVHNRVVSWTVLLHPAFDREFQKLSESVQDELLAHAKVLELIGPTLGRPRVTR